MTRASAPSSPASWQKWATPNLAPDEEAAPQQSAAPQAMQHTSAQHLAIPHPTVQPDTLRRALLAEEQRQVFALLSRLRQARKG